MTRQEISWMIKIFGNVNHLQTWKIMSLEQELNRAGSETISSIAQQYKVTIPSEEQASQALLKSGGTAQQLT